MFTWLTKLFKGTSVPEVINVVAKDESKVEQPKAEVKPHNSGKEKTTAPKATKSTKKAAPKKAKDVDLDSMNKTQLLDEAKKRGVKANASLKKEEILERIKNG